MTFSFALRQRNIVRNNSVCSAGSVTTGRKMRIHQCQSAGRLGRKQGKQAAGFLRLRHLVDRPDACGEQLEDGTGPLPPSAGESS